MLVMWIETQSISLFERGYVQCQNNPRHEKDVTCKFSDGIGCLMAPPNREKAVYIVYMERYVE